MTTEKSANWFTRYSVRLQGASLASAQDTLCICSSCCSHSYSRAVFWGNYINIGTSIPIRCLLHFLFHLWSEENYVLRFVFSILFFFMNRRILCRIRSGTIRGEKWDIQRVEKISFHCVRRINWVTSLSCSFILYLFIFICIILFPTQTSSFYFFFFETGVRYTIVHTYTYHQMQNLLRQ